MPNHTQRTRPTRCDCICRRFAHEQVASISHLYRAAVSDRAVPFSLLCPRAVPCARPGQGTESVASHSMRRRGCPICCCAPWFHLGGFCATLAERTFSTDLASFQICAVYFLCRAGCRWHLRSILARFSQMK